MINPVLSKPFRVLVGDYAMKKQIEIKIDKIRPSLPHGWSLTHVYHKQMV